MADELHELGSIIASNREVRQSVDNLADRLDDLGDRMEGRFRRAQTVIVILAVALIAAGGTIGWLIWKTDHTANIAVNNSKRIDKITNDNTISQCETTAFFLNIALNPAEPRVDQTDREKKQLENFIKVYQKAYDRLNCDKVLRGPMLPEDKSDQEEPKKERGGG